MHILPTCKYLETNWEEELTPFFQIRSLRTKSQLSDCVARMTKILVALRLRCSGHATLANTHLRNAYKAFHSCCSAPANTADRHAPNSCSTRQRWVFQKRQKPAALPDGNTSCSCPWRNKGTKQCPWYIQSSEPTISTRDKIMRQNKQKASLISGLMHATINSDIQIHAVLNKHKIVFPSSFKNLVSWYIFTQVWYNRLLFKATESCVAKTHLTSWLTSWFGQQG